MTWYHALLSAFSTYSAIPTPRYRWDERVGALTLCFFPAVGLVCGGLLALWHALCLALDAPAALFAAGAVCLPLLVTGGIHMDGYMDTSDALSSHQSRERKLEIMKDPHTGAFAVIYCGVYLLLSYGLFSALYASAALWVLCPGYVLSRALSALCASLLPKARRDGMLRRYTDPMRKGSAVPLCAVAALAAAGMLWLRPLPGLAALAAAGLALLCYRALALRVFGGVTGDTAGFFLELCEGMLLLGVWIGGLL